MAELKNVSKKDDAIITEFEFSEKDDEILKEFELIEMGLENTIEVNSPKLRAAMARSWQERTSILYANAALADSVYLREGMSERLLEVRDEFQNLLDAAELSNESSVWSRLKARLGKQTRTPKESGNAQHLGAKESVKR